ncbi:redoxin domain-containing protein [Parasediminibacterium sp. JCM 36343]|uniref:redoxin domain-containing protein n=1 Tax=Parasediminibacterium sp. JCM 36343 TaxID=3374279 RepID=UPI00397E5C6D
MKHFANIIVLLLIATHSFEQVKKPVAKATAAPSSGSHIAITLKPYKNIWVYIGSYYGKGKTLVDSAFLDENSKGVFKPAKKYTPGIYFVVSPTYSILFELLMDEKQQFSIDADTLKKDNPVITGSMENDLFKSYSEYSVEKGKKISALTEQYKKAPTKADSSKIRTELVEENKLLQTYREDLIKKNPSSLLATLLNAMKQPDYPAIPVVNGKADTLYPYHHVKDHFWDDVEFNDDRLLRTPFFETKVDTYFKTLVPNDPDSIYKEVKYMLLFARTGKEMYPYLLTKFTNKYINPEYMGQDKVFIKIFEDFYAKGDTTYLNAASRKTIIERAYSMMANQLGNPAPPLDLVDTAGKIASLYNVKGKFTFVVFWDPTCGHCKEELPRIDSIYKARWKSVGLKLYSVNVSTAANTTQELKKFVNDKKLDTDWLYTSQTKEAREAEQAAGQPNFRQLYDVYKTPTMYLLDEQKHIIAKQLSIEQFNDIITAKIKSNAKK